MNESSPSPESPRDKKTFNPKPPRPRWLPLQREYPPLSSGPESEPHPSSPSSDDGPASDRSQGAEDSENRNA